MRANDAYVRIPIPRPIHQTLSMLQTDGYVRSGNKPTIIQILDDVLSEACEARGVTIGKTKPLKLWLRGFPW